MNVLLDITRLTSRVGRGPFTGVDRVELAYLRWCLEGEGRLHGLARVAGGFCLLDRDGLLVFLDKLTGVLPWGSRDLRGLVGVKTPKPRAQAESDLRKLAISRCNRVEFSQLLSGLDPDGVYLNIGHSNISDGLFAAIKGHGLSIAAFIHDVIPLELPQYQRPGTVEAFAARLETVQRYGDLILTNSADSKRRIEGFLTTEVSIEVAHLGVEAPKHVMADAGNDRPYFVTIGTIEPRKNHGLLLDVWDMFDNPDTCPVLHNVGQRGWENHDVFTRLDALRDAPHVIEHNDLGDGTLWPLVAGSHGLLFPSLAEGFGLPSLEAAALGVPVVCGDLAIHRELLGAYPVYLGLDDPYLWKKTITEQADKRLDDLRREVAKDRPQIPTWEEHFSHVTDVLLRMR